MRTITSGEAKGAESPRRLRDDVKLLGSILIAFLDYLVTGYPIRKRFFASRAAGEKIYLDEDEAR
ncbi:MAG: hypothetical protein ACE5JX_21555 [Acidobacteriota bacterium]